MLLWRKWLTGRHFGGQCSFPDSRQQKLPPSPTGVFINGKEVGTGNDCQAPFRGGGLKTPVERRRKVICSPVHL